MKSFKAKIHKVGINPCVDVPEAVTRNMIATKGYIRVKGKINNHLFEQTLVPVKNGNYRLYVNGAMLKGSASKVGEKVRFSLQQDVESTNQYPKMPAAFQKRLKLENLYQNFNELIPSRQKEILKYLNYLKTQEALDRNIDRVINQLKKGNEF